MWVKQDNADKCKSKSQRQRHMPEEIFKMLSPIMKAWKKELHVNTKVPKICLTLPQLPFPWSNSNSCVEERKRKIEGRELIKETQKSEDIPINFCFYPWRHLLNHSSIQVLKEFSLMLCYLQSAFLS